MEFDGHRSRYLAVVFRCPWWAILLALLVGALVGVIGLLLRRFREAVAIIPFLAAFASTAIVGLVAATTGFEQVPLFALPRSVDGVTKPERSAAAWPITSPLAGLGSTTMSDEIEPGTDRAPEDEDA